MPEFLKTEWKKLSASARVIVLCAVTAVTLCVLICIPFPGKAADSNPVSMVRIQWGNADCTVTNDYVSPMPGWVGSVFKAGGQWTNSAWHVEASDTNEASLNIDINTNTLPGLDMVLDYFDHTNASLYVGYYDTNDQLLATNVFGNLIEQSNCWAAMYLPLQLANYPGVAGIRIYRASGEATVSNTFLYVYTNGDGLGDGQEAVGNGGNAPTVRMPRESLETKTLSGDTTVAQSTGRQNLLKKGHVLYVDANIGDDSLDGGSDNVSDRANLRGPKKTMNAALNVADDGDTIYVAGGEYRENVRNGKARMIAVGRVILK